MKHESIVNILTEHTNKEAHLQAWHYISRSTSRNAFIIPTKAENMGMEEGGGVLVSGWQVNPAAPLPLPFFLPSKSVSNETKVADVFQHFLSGSLHQTHSLRFPSAFHHTLSVQLLHHCSFFIAVRYDYIRCIFSLLCVQCNRTIYPSSKGIPIPSERQQKEDQSMMWRWLRWKALL